MLEHACAQVNLHAWPGDANLLDQKAHEFLTLFEVGASIPVRMRLAKESTFAANRLLTVSSWRCAMSASRSCSNCRWRLVTLCCRVWNSARSIACI